MDINKQPGSDRAQHEIEHGKFLASGETEAIWGWGSAAGARRAEKRGAAIIKAAGLRPGVRALELGCGTGLFTRMFAETGAELIANDISTELIERARETNPAVTFICAQFEDLPSTKPYHAIIGSSVLHHLDLGRALLKSYALLKPGGVMAFAEPNMLNPQVFAERTFLRRMLSYVSPDESAFVRWSLAATLKSNGFGEIKINPFDWLHPAVPASLVNSVEHIGSFLERMPIVREFAGSLLIFCRKPVK
ncbi:MAG: class I SAM-dependent methyltransferase [Anaerolineales bacterium]